MKKLGISAPRLSPARSQPAARASLRPRVRSAHSAPRAQASASASAARGATCSPPASRHAAANVAPAASAASASAPTGSIASQCTLASCRVIRSAVAPRGGSAGLAPCATARIAGSTSWLRARRAAHARTRSAQLPTVRARAPRAPPAGLAFVDLVLHLELRLLERRGRRTRIASMHVVAREREVAHELGEPRAEARKSSPRDGCARRYAARALRSRRESTRASAGKFTASARGRFDAYASR